MVPIFVWATLSLLFTITIHFHNFFSLFAKISITVYTIFLFTIRLKVLAFGGHMQCVFGHMCLNSWGGLPWKTRCPTTVLTYMYVCTCMYAWIALTYVPALAMCTRVRAHANTHQRRACSYYQRPAPAMHAHAGKFFVKIVLSNGSFFPTHSACISFWIPKRQAISTDTSCEVKIIVKIYMPLKLSSDPTSPFRVTC